MTSLTTRTIVKKSPKKTKIVSVKKVAISKSTKKTSLTKNVTPKKTSSHPPVATMVTKSIEALNDKGGSSFVAIKKYISGTYKIDAEKLAPFIKKYLKNAVESGVVIQPKGRGATGSFKLAKDSTVAMKKKTSEKTVKKVAPKKKTASLKVSKKSVTEKKSPKTVKVAKTAKTVEKKGTKVVEKK